MYVALSYKLLAVAIVEFREGKVFEKTDFSPSGVYAFKGKIKGKWEYHDLLLKQVFLKDPLCSSWFRFGMNHVKLKHKDKEYLACAKDLNQAHINAYAQVPEVAGAWEKKYGGEK